MRLVAAVSEQSLAECHEVGVALEAGRVLAGAEKRENLTSRPGAGHHDPACRREELRYGIALPVEQAALVVRRLQVDLLARRPAAAVVPLREHAQRLVVEHAQPQPVEDPAHDEEERLQAARRCEKGVGNPFAARRHVPESTYADAWSPYSSAYSPPCPASSSCVPDSTISPSCRT